jgi:hypothetical protein
MKAKHFSKIRTLADKLMATCQPNEYWEEVDELSKDECVTLDAIVFECQGCNHWFSASERHEGSNAQWYCKDCL